jgi:hypothetical protein
MLKLNVGLSRKVADNNYGSRGASVNVELEVESAVAAEPGKLRERIRQAFSLVRDSLFEELNGNGQAKPAGQNGQNPATKPSNGQNAAPVKGATQSQVRAIAAIAKRHNLNLDVLLAERFHVKRTQDLSIKQASQLIDDLKQGG